MKRVFSREHVYSLRRDELLEIVEAMEGLRGEHLEQIAKFVGKDQNHAIRQAGRVDLLDDFISEIRTELDRRNAIAKNGTEGEVNDGPV